MMKFVSKVLAVILFTVQGAFGQIDIGLPADTLKPTFEQEPIAAAIEEPPVLSVLEKSPHDTFVNTEEQALIDKSQRLVPLTPECIWRVSNFYGIHHDILFAILLTEGGSIGQTNKGNKDGTKDLSLFQINETNLPELDKSFGITREDVLNNGCLGAAIAARHLLISIRDAPPPTNRAEYLSMLARYHSKTPEHNAVYALKLEKNLNYLASMDKQ